MYFLRHSGSTEWRDAKESPFVMFSLTCPSAVLYTRDFSMLEETPRQANIAARPWRVSSFVTAVRHICRQPPACWGSSRFYWREVTGVGRAGSERCLPLWSHEGPLEKRWHSSQAFTSHVDLSHWRWVGKCPSIRDSTNNVSETRGCREKFGT